ncbi:hypothetical protein AWB71_02580 [Caballeronia peredens]|nr:hypothetical protein AWB71_02580 [Caballeronia peredens]
MNLLLTKSYEIHTSNEINRRLRIDFVHEININYLEEENIS